MCRSTFHVRECKDDTLAIGVEPNRIGEEAKSQVTQELLELPGGAIERLWVSRERFLASGFMMKWVRSFVYEHSNNLIRTLARLCHLLDHHLKEFGVGGSRRGSGLLSRLTTIQILHRRIFRVVGNSRAR